MEELFRFTISRLLGDCMNLTGPPTWPHARLPEAHDALDACRRNSERYWFWTGVGSKATLAGNRRRAFRRLCEMAGVQFLKKRSSKFAVAGQDFQGLNSVQSRPGDRLDVGTHLAMLEFGLVTT